MFDFWLTALVNLIARASERSNSDEGMTNVHFVAHSHMDAGWWMTFRGYYSGQSKRIFKSVFPRLQENAHYKYTIGDIAFFREYYEEQDEAGK